MHVILNDKLKAAFKEDIYLTLEEQDVLDCIIDGLTIQEKAKKLKMSTSKIGDIKESLKKKYDFAYKIDSRLFPRFETKADKELFMEKYPNQIKRAFESKNEES